MFAHPPNRIASWDVAGNAARDYLGSGGIRSKLAAGTAILRRTPKTGIRGRVRNLVAETCRCAAQPKNPRAAKI